MAVFNKIALFFVILYSVFIMINTYLGESERIGSNVMYFLMNGFAYIVSAMEVEKEKQIVFVTGE
ncbi:hypothetical protein J1P26_07620 [Neobacillus sp. MM2021_6]|uniref:hypothetical protein n=1 Tax=Bacillaceae TaxID=186817 RepID=UPI001407AD24|nr:MULTISPECIES: hypothetical protein [Bacillaceae]MBO0959589.1 hypothetical protein [Neobacillus sp. MM2021_6]NHC20175.1 hypothetical protein [Bacillus sp. MM2020_4]